MKHSILCCIGILGLTACTSTAPSNVQIPEIKVILLLNPPDKIPEETIRSYQILSG